MQNRHRFQKNGQQIGFELLANFMLFRGLNPLDNSVRQSGNGSSGSQKPPGGSRPGEKLLRGNQLYSGGLGPPQQVHFFKVDSRRHSLLRRNFQKCIRK